MKVPVARWKYWWSYISEVPIESRETAYNDVINLCLVRGRFQLYTENAIYSFEDYYDNFYQTFKKINLDLLPGNQVLILGYAMASIPLMLENKFNRNFEYTGIEIDEEILDLANTYILPRLESKQTLICTDAKIFVETNTEKYDMICVDLFIDNIIPQKFETENFLKQLKEKLNPGGVLLYNRLANDNERKKVSSSFYETYFKPIFKNSEQIILDDNWIIVSDAKYLE